MLFDMNYFKVAKNVYSWINFALLKHFGHPVTIQYDMHFHTWHCSTNILVASNCVNLKSARTIKVQREV